MKASLDDRDLILLESIQDAGVPVGSWFLVEELEKKGCKISSASIGRILFRLESLGFVESQTNKGRILTANGLKAMEKARTISSIDRHKKDLEKLINSRILDEFIMVLQARKAIERETARLAAENITESKLAHLKAIIEEQEAKAAQGESIAEVDIAFHRGIAEASNNSALLALYGILSMMGQQSDLFEYVRSRVDSPYRSAHRSILEALTAHDGDEAERRIIKHMDSLIADVGKYWEHIRD
ncbi:MAG: FCD domain-containing protein [Treponemataceae bacterium]